MRQILLLLFFVLGLISTWHAQITANGTPAPCQSMTAYTNGAPNDPIFYYQPGQLGSLTATPPSGTPGWTFAWAKASGNTWVNLITLSNMPSSTMNNLAQGAYRVTITDGNGVVVGAYRAWILQITQLPLIDIEPLEATCNGPLSLSGTVQQPTVSPYHNLPPDPVIFTSNSSITVCFNFTHSYVSDLGFRLKGPASCGSPIITLFPPTGNICNSGDDATNLCFTNNTAGNFFMCGATTPLAGTYSSYNGIPINWSALEGCDLTAPGWAPLIIDAYVGDAGIFTSSSISFTGQNILGTTQTVSHNFGSTPIITGSTSNPVTATPPIITPTYPPINCSFGYQWTSNPPLLIPNSTTSLNIELTELRDPQNNVIPWQDVEFSLGITSPCSGALNCLGNDAVDVQQFEVEPTEATIINTPPAVCISGSPVTLTATPSNGTWSGPGITNGTSGTFAPQIAGLGSHTITFEPADPCFNDTTIVIQVQDLPDLAITSPDGFCIDGSPYQFTSAVAGGTWSGPGITAAGVFTPATAGIGTHVITYQVTGSCPATDTKTIQVHSLPIISAGADAVICSGSTTQLQGSGGVSYVWSPSSGINNVNSATPNATPPSNNFTYTVVGTDANGCSASDQVTLTFFAPPTVTASDDPAIICPGTPTPLSATGTTANGLPGTYLWSPSTGVTGANTANPTMAPYQTTTYTVTFTDNCGLTATDQVVVTTELYHSVELPTTAQYCFGESVTLNATVTGTSPSLEWSSSVPGFGTTPHTSPTLIVTQPGTYILTVTSPMGCIHSDQTQVLEIPLPNPYLPSTMDLCPNKTVTLNAGSNWNQVQWSNGISGATTTVSAPGVYTATVTHNGCQNTVSSTVVLVNMPVVNLGPDIAICDGTLASFNIPVSGLWSTGVNSNSIQVSRAGKYYVTVNVGSCVASDTIEVRIKPRPIANLPEQIVGCLEGTITINAENLVNTSYLWSTGETTPMIEVSDFGVYSVTTSNDCGTASDSARAYFQDCTYAIYIPNTFTPDNDGINEVWQISTYNVSKLTLRIFNRWGEAVYTTHDLNPIWTGEANGGEYYVRDGVYSFHMIYETINGELGERSGNIFLLR